MPKQHNILYSACIYDSNDCAQPYTSIYFVTVFDMRFVLLIYMLSKRLQRQSFSGTNRHFSSVSPRETFRTGSDGSISDKDETDDNPPTLVGLLRNRAALLAGRTVPGVSPAVMSDSDYYGSGEWANAAMSTLRQLQSAMNSVKVSVSNFRLGLKVVDAIVHFSCVVAPHFPVVCAIAATTECAVF